MRLTIAYSKIKKRNLVLINNATYQRETLSDRPIRQPLNDISFWVSRQHAIRWKDGRVGWWGVVEECPIVLGVYGACVCWLSVTLYLSMFVILSLTVMPISFDNRAVCRGVCGCGVCVGVGVGVWVEGGVHVEWI